MQTIYNVVTFPTSRLLALSLLTWDSAMSALDRWVLFIQYPGLQFLELLLATLHGEVLGLIQTVLQVLDCDLQVLLHPLQMSTGVSLHLLLDSQGIIPAPDLSIKSGLHGLNHPLAVPLDLLHLLIFLSQLPVNLTFDLVELKLDTKDLGLLVLYCALKHSHIPNVSYKHSQNVYMVTYRVCYCILTCKCNQDFTSASSSAD
uniref:Uncharacterized protein n=1 Tax=Monopterus albus TaxID=43700 RepID=A0A3Q3JNK8_MONAL